MTAVVFGERFVDRLGRHFINVAVSLVYGFAEAHTTFGRLGVKVWIYKGEVIASRAEREAAALAQAQAGKSERPRRAPRAPRGEVTTSSVEERAQESAPAATAEVTTEVKSEGGEA